MSVPLLRLGANFDSHIIGEVMIDPTAVLAPGVILQAAPNSRIIIGSGVCIGMGSILHVSVGTLEVEAGANLGAGFLMVGAGKVGANACIGSATTVFNCSIEPGKVVPPGSILGDTSRQISEPASINPNPAFDNVGEIEKVEQVSITPNSEISSVDQEVPSVEFTNDSSNNFGAHIYGQGNIQRLLVTLFPHRQSLKKTLSDEESE